MDDRRQTSRQHGFRLSPADRADAPTSAASQTRAERERVATELLTAALAALAQQDRVRFEHILGWRPLR
jgi:hypothetical protein